MYSNYQIMKILESCFQNMNYFPWAKLISVLIHLRYWYYNTPSLQLPCLPRHPCQIPLWSTETPFQRNPYHVLHRFPYFFPTPFDHMLQLLNIPNHMRNQANQIIINLYTKYKTWLVQQATYQKSEFLRATALSKLDKTVSNNFIFNTKSLVFSAK